jgi:hypothetical protein
VNCCVPAVPHFVLMNHSFFLSFQFVLVNAFLILISPQIILVSDVFPTSPHFVFDSFFKFQMIPVIGEQVLFSATLVTVNHIWYTAKAQLFSVNCILKD